MAINDELKKIYLDANVNISLIRTIELSHPSFSQNWYLAMFNDTSSFKGKIEDGSLVTYQGYGFELTLPDATTKGQSNAQFVIDATDVIVLKDLWAYKANPTEPIILNWREYLNNSPEIQNSLMNIKLMDVEFNYNQIQGSGSRPDIINRGFPHRRYDETILKGLKYL